MQSIFTRIQCCFIERTYMFSDLGVLRQHMCNHLGGCPKEILQKKGKSDVKEFFTVKKPSEIKSQLTVEIVFALELDGTHIPKSTIQMIIKKIKKSLLQTFKKNF